MEHPPISEYELNQIARGFKFRKERRDQRGDQGWWYNEGAQAALDFMIKEVSRYFGQETFECTCVYEEDEVDIDPKCELHSGW